MKIGAAIIRLNSTEMARTDVAMDSKSMWAKVRKPTGRNRVDEGQGQSCVVTAEILNHHCASIASDSSYIKPEVKMTVNQRQDHISEWRMFNILNNLRQTATGTAQIPAWFLKVGAHVFGGPLAV